MDYIASHPVELVFFLYIFYYSLISIVGNLNLGIRHLFPILPLIYILVSEKTLQFFKSFKTKTPKFLSRLTLTFLLLWFGLSSAFAFPNYMSYFNEMIGGGKNAYLYFTDSNVDWGQDLKPLAGWLKQRGIPSVKLSYFGTGDPEYYRIPGQLLPGYVMPVFAGIVREVSSGDIVVVSATNLQCVYLDPDVCSLMERLRPMEPIGQVGHSILVYRADFSWP